MLYSAVKDNWRTIVTKAKTPEERAAKREAYQSWMWRRVDQLHAEANAGKKRRAKGWTTKKECWHRANKEYIRMRQDAAARDRTTGVSSGRDR
jgi:hypothetical protein